ncbi:MAG: hypothetical protein LBB41_05865, partial [Prevotellaceae bacterium]|nr:hypothetical protein [Prevotellaceae bacterium]
SRVETPKIETDTRKLLKNISIIVIINAIVIISIIALCTLFLQPALTKTSLGSWANIVTLAIGTLLSLPFLWGLIFDNPSNTSGLKLLKSEIYNRRTLLVVEIVRLVIGFALVGYLADVCIGTKLTFLMFLPLLLVILIFLFKKIKFIYKSIEKRFMLNLHGRELAAAEKEAPMNSIRRRLHSRNPAMTDWDVHLTDLEVPQHARYIGRMLRELEWREKFGINVVYIKRGEQIIYAPGPNSKIMPFDHIGVFTTDEILEKFKPAFEAEQQIHHDYDLEDIVVEKICIDFDNPLLGKSIKHSGIREQTGGMVMAIERDNSRILTPDPALVFHEMDIVWIVGEKKHLKKLKTLA